MYASIYPQPTIVSANKNKSDIKFPEDVQVILRADRQEWGNLYLSNIEAAENPAIIESLKIGAIMCVAKGNATKHPKELVKYSKYIAIEEDDNVEIGQFLDEGVAFISQKLKLTNVLVHCVAGTNRSACFIIAYLMKHRNLSLEDAYNEVKSRRKVISPTDHMFTQLKMYQKGNQKNKIIIQDKSMRYEQPSVRNDAVTDRSIKIKTNILDRSNFLGVDDQQSVNGSRVTGRSVRAEDKDERRSCRSNKSFGSKVSQSNLDVLNQSKIAMKNPEESFISKQSKAPSILNKSFSHKSPSQRMASQVSQLSDLPELKLEKKASSSREEFTQKIRELDCKNNSINQKINFIQQKFENQNQNSRLTLEAQLNEISQLRTNMYSERKSRLSRIAQDNCGTGVDYVPLYTTEK